MYQNAKLLCEQKAASNPSPIGLSMPSPPSVYSFASFPYVSLPPPPLLQRLGPQVLARLRIKANERQRSRYAAYVDARRVQKKYLNAWHFVVVQTAAVRR